MSKEIDQITLYLDKLAQKLGVGAEHIWPWFIKQQYVDAFALFALMTILIGYGVCALKAYNRVELAYSEEKIKYNQKEFWSGFWAITGVITLVVGIIVSIFATIEVAELFNIEYSAMKDFVSTFKQLM